MAVNGSNGHTGERLVGAVEAVNERGVKLGGQWRNISKWAEDVAMPSRGQVVSLTLDGSGFIRGIAPADAGAGAHQTPVAGRETAITRLAVLAGRPRRSAPPGPSSGAATCSRWPSGWRTGSRVEK